ncbi:MAG: hypothetical protein ACO24H_03245 [Polynucleobacter sp.]
MSVIVTRAGKGSPLTNNEVDANFVNLNNGKVDTTSSYADPGWITSLSETKVLPSQTGQAGKFLTTNGTNTSWAAGGGGGGGDSPIFYTLDTITSNMSVDAGKNGFSVGPLTVNSGVSVTVASGQRWVIV